VLLRLDYRGAPNVRSSSFVRVILTAPRLGRQAPEPILKAHSKKMAHAPKVPGLGQVSQEHCTEQRKHWT